QQFRGQIFLINGLRRHIKCQHSLLKYLFCGERHNFHFLQEGDVLHHSDDNCLVFIRRRRDNVMLAMVAHSADHNTVAHQNRHGEKAYLVGSSPPPCFGNIYVYTGDKRRTIRPHHDTRQLDYPFARLRLGGVGTQHKHPHQYADYQAEPYISVNFPHHCQNVKYNNKPINGLMRNIPHSALTGPKCGLRRQTGTSISFLTTLSTSCPEEKTFFILCRFDTINTMSGITPPTVNNAPPTIRIHVSVWNVALSTNALLRAYQSPCSTTALNCNMPAGKRSITTISRSPMLIDQNAVRTSRGFQASGLNNS